MQETCQVALAWEFHGAFLTQTEIERRHRPLERWLAWRQALMPAVAEITAGQHGTVHDWSDWARGMPSRRAGEPIMSGQRQAGPAIVPRAPITPQVGDVVRLHGTNIIGNVTCVDSRDGRGCLSVQVTTVRGKKRGSKAARAWTGAWVTCPPEMVTPLPAGS